MGWMVSGKGWGDSGTKVLGAASWGEVHAWLSGTVSPWDGTCSGTSGVFSTPPEVLEERGSMEIMEEPLTHASS